MDDAFQSACSADKGLIINGKTEQIDRHAADRDEIPFVSVTADGRAAEKRLIAHISNADEIDGFISTVTGCLPGKRFRVSSCREFPICKVIGCDKSDV